MLRQKTHTIHSRASFLQQKIENRLDITLMEKQKYVFLEQNTYIFCLKNLDEIYVLELSGAFNAPR